MKAFWALMSVLAIVAVVMLATDLGGKTQTSAPSPPHLPPVQPAIDAAPLVEPPSAATAKPAAPEPAIEVPISRPEPSTPAAVQPAPAAPAVEAPPPPAPAASAPSAPAVVAVPTPENPKPESAPKVETPAATPPSAPASTQEENILIKLRQDIEAERGNRVAAAKLAPTPGPEAATPEASAAQGGTTDLFGDARAEAKPDGSLLIDGKFIVKGKGTQADPYKITWDQLISAERDYAPKEGKKSIPPRIQALHDTWVEITGYIAFPLMAAETDELLSMMNQWDGCCIGIPPTPYDAIEVRLSRPVSGDGRLTTYGTIKGRFKVDPHLVGGWLVGLYVMDQGTLTPVAFGGVAP